MNEKIKVLKDLSRRIRTSQKAIKSNSAKIQDILGHVEFECVCEGKHALSAVTCIQTHWYESPHGCTGGDTWHRSDMHVVCPTTGVRNRVLFLSNTPENLEERVASVLYKVTKTVEQERNRSTSGRWLNNYWFADNMGPILDAAGM